MQPLLYFLSVLPPVPVLAFNDESRDANDDEFPFSCTTPPQDMQRGALSRVEDGVCASLRRDLTKNPLLIIPFLTTYSNDLIP